MHITIGDWWDKNGALIAEQQWIDAVAADGELHMVGEVTGENPRTGEPITIRNDLLAVSRNHPSGREVPCSFRSGRVVVARADKACIEKMKEVAANLVPRFKATTVSCTP